MREEVMIPRALLSARPSVVAVYASLRAMSDDAGGGEVVASYADIAFRCGVAPRTARGAVATLRNGGWVEMAARVRWGVRLRVCCGARNAVGNDTVNAAVNDTLKTSASAVVSDNCGMTCHSGGHSEWSSDDTPEKVKETEKEKDTKEKEKESENNHTHTHTHTTGGRTYAYAQERPAADGKDESQSMSITEWAQMYMEPPQNWLEVQKVAPVYTGRQWTEQMCRAFISHYASLGWRTPAGGIIRDWREKLQAWILSENKPHLGMKGAYCGARRGAMDLDRYEPGF